MMASGQRIAPIDTIDVIILPPVDYTNVAGCCVDLLPVAGRPVMLEAGCSHVETRACCPALPFPLLIRVSGVLLMMKPLLLEQHAPCMSM
jgi:hypothetical protein